MYIFGHWVVSNMTACIFGRSHGSVYICTDVISANNLTQLTSNFNKFGSRCLSHGNTSCDVIAHSSLEP